MSDTAHRRGFLAWFPQNPVAANLLMLAIVVGGVLTIPGVRLEVFPEIRPNVIRVAVDYPGATPAEVERAICMRLEDAIDGVTGIDKITSLASEGSGSLAIETLQEADLQQVLDDVKTRVDAIDSFPEEAENPVIQEVLMRRQVIDLAVFGEVDEDVLKRIAERVRDEVNALPGVSQVELANVRPYEVSIEVPELALREHGLTLDRVAAAVQRASVDLSGGSVKTQAGEVLLRTDAQAERREDFERIVLLTRPDGSRLLLGDVARVVDGFEDVDRAARFNGRRVATIQVYRVGDESALEIAAAVRGYLDEARAWLPDGVRIEPWQDAAQWLEGRLELLLRNGFQGLVLVFGILALFLRFRLSFWVTLGIPVSFLGVLAVMPSLDVSLNMLSLFAFILVCAGVWIMRVRRPDLPRGFTVPLLPAVSTLGIIVCGAMIYGLGWTNWLRLAGWLALGMIFYFAYGRQHSVLNQAR